MKKFVVGLIAATTFTVGMVFGLLVPLRHERATMRIDKSATPTYAPTLALSPSYITETSNPQESDLPPEHPLRTALNGTKLPLNYENSENNLATDMNVVLLSSGRMLVGLHDKLYLLDKRKRIVWQYVTDQLLIDFKATETTNFVYGTGGDNTMFILDLASGKELFRDSRNGRAGYGQVEILGKDICLVTDEFSGYREMRWESSSTPNSIMKDGVTAWRGTKMLWHIDFPPDAQLHVNGNTIFAVTQTERGVYVREVTVPNGKR